LLIKEFLDWWTGFGCPHVGTALKQVRGGFVLGHFERRVGGSGSRPEREITDSMSATIKEVNCDLQPGVSAFG